MLEHINLRVPSISKTQHFLAAAFANFCERGRGLHPHFGLWSHFGNNTQYIALLQNPDESEPSKVRGFKHDDNYRLMHIAFVVEDIEALMTRLAEHGYKPYLDGDLNSHPHRRRVYYLDHNGIEFEFIQYLSEEIAERHDYSS